MMQTIELWRLLAGVALFLLGMHYLQTSLDSLAGRRFKLFLKKQTSNRLKAIAGGAVVTGILQSSSVVNLMILAFVSAGILHMTNALALMLGSNLGTTLTGWLIATLGFRFNLENLAFPVLGISGLLLVILNRQSRWYTAAGFFMGFGLLFTGLDFMKSGTESFVDKINLAALQQYPSLVFLLAGILITSLIQSSSATIAIVLTAMHAGVIGLEQGALLAIGSEIGTTLKLLLAAVNGPAVTRRVALGNFLYNGITVLIIYFLRLPLIHLLTQSLGVKDPLIALVLFQTSINLGGILLFYPLLPAFAHFLERRYRSANDESLYVSKVKPQDVELALLAFRNETFHLIQHIIRFCLSVFDLPDEPKEDKQRQDPFNRKSPLEKYEDIKKLHGMLHSYYVELQSHIGSKEETERLDLLIASVRNGMYAAKSMKDAHYDATRLRNSSNEKKYQFYLDTRSRIRRFFDQLQLLMQEENKGSMRESLMQLYQEVVSDYNRSLSGLYHLATPTQLNQVEISTIVNFNRELFTCLKSMVYAMKGCYLSPAEAAGFDDLPGFIR